MPQKPDYALLLRLALSHGDFNERVMRLHALNLLHAPLVLIKPDLSSASVVTLTPKKRGFFQRTTFYLSKGPTAEDDIHESLEHAVVTAFDLGFQVLVDPKLLSHYMP